MVYNAAGSPSGEAFIQMDSELAAESAAINRHKKFMLLAGPQGRKRYIEVFQCSSADMSVVLTNPDLPASLQIPGVNIPQTPNFASGLQSTLNLTPPGLSAGASPQQGSPTGQAAPSPAQFSLPQMLQQQQHTPQPQRNPLLSPSLPVSSAGAMMTSLGAYGLPQVSTATATAQQPVAALQQQQLLAQLAQQQYLLGQQPGGLQQMPGAAQAAATAGAARPAVPGLYGASPMLYYYPSPPISPQNYFNTAAAAVAASQARSADPTGANEGAW